MNRPEAATRIAAVVAAGMTAALMFCAAPAGAQPVPPGCARVPIFGLDPYVLKVCDTPIRPDGSWTRFRQQWRIGGYQSTCGGGRYRMGADGCPPWAERDFVPNSLTPTEEYTVTPDTIPPGEPGHLD